MPATTMHHPLVINYDNRLPLKQMLGHHTSKKQHNKRHSVYISGEKHVRRFLDNGIVHHGFVHLQKGGPNVANALAALMPLVAQPRIAASP